MQFPGFNNASVIFKAQEPVASVKLRLVYCYPEGSSVDLGFVQSVRRHLQKTHEIYRQYGINVLESPIELKKLSADLYVDNGEADPANNFTYVETNEFQKEVLRAQFGDPFTEIIAAFTEASISSLGESGRGSLRGFTPAGTTRGSGRSYISLSLANRGSLPTTAHEIVHAFGFYDYAPNESHWLMKKNGGTIYGPSQKHREHKRLSESGYETAKQSGYYNVNH